jgi:hypothetical protein
VFGANIRCEITAKVGTSQKCNLKVCGFSRLRSEFRIHVVPGMHALVTA